MNSKKKRPTSSSKTHRVKGQGGSHVIQEHRPLPSSSQLIVKKYYLPAIQEDEKQAAFYISRFLSGIRYDDHLQLAELTIFYGSGENLLRRYQKAEITLRWTIADSLQQRGKVFLQPKFFSTAQGILELNARKKYELKYPGSSLKKQSLKSTEVPSKKQIKNVLGSGLSDESGNLNESEQFGRLSRCLKKALKLHSSNGGSKGYRAFVSQMEKRTEKKEQSQGMLNLILNLEKDFSSIQQEQGGFQYSKQSIYGLSDLKRKSDRNNSKLEPKAKQKKTSLNFPFCHMNFMKKNLNMGDRTGTCNSTSKNSGKSVSVRKSKQNIGTTPDNHRLKSKSKSTTKKNGNKLYSDKKSKLTDTEKLYYDEGSEKGEEQKDLKSLLKEGCRRMQGQGAAKSKKKGFRT